MEKAMQMLSKEADHMDEDDPKHAANLMRKLSDMTGLHLGPGMEEAGGKGVVASREYEEMTLDSLRAMGKAIDEISKS